MAVRAAVALAMVAAVSGAKLVKMTMFTDDACTTASTDPAISFVPDVCIRFGDQYMKWSCASGASLGTFSDAACATNASTAAFATATTCVEGKKASCVDATYPISPSAASLVSIADYNEKTCSAAGLQSSMLVSGGCFSVPQMSGMFMSIQCDTVASKAVAQVFSDAGCATMKMQMDLPSCEADEGSNNSFTKFSCGTKSSTASSLNLYSSSTCAEPFTAVTVADVGVCFKTKGMSSNKLSFTGTTWKMEVFKGVGDCSGTASVADTKTGTCGTCALFMDDKQMGKMYGKVACPSVTASEAHQQTLAVSVVSFVAVVAWLLQ